eukprot:1799942-Alexandrium_andersonii.AAC.1
MSASLVGSEMCIRDRVRRALARILLSPPRGASPQTPLTGAGASGPTAVSYTHLTLPTICSV